MYTVGAAVYALRRPDPLPRVFGYHEIFHALVIAAAALHFAAHAVCGAGAGVIRASTADRSAALSACRGRNELTLDDEAKAKAGRAATAIAPFAERSRDADRE